MPFAVLLLLFAIHTLRRRRAASIVPSPTTPLPALDKSDTRHRLSGAFDGAHSDGGAALKLKPQHAKGSVGIQPLASALAVASFAVVAPLCDTADALCVARDALAVGTAAALALSGILPPSYTEISFATEFAAAFAAADAAAASAAPCDAAAGPGSDADCESSPESTPIRARARSPSSPPPRRPSVPMSISSPSSVAELAVILPRPSPCNDGSFNSPMPLAPAIFNASPSELEVHKLIVASEANQINAALVAVHRESNCLAAKAHTHNVASDERHAAFVEHASLRASAADALGCGIVISGYFLYQSTARLGDAVATCGRPLAGLGVIGLASSPSVILDAASWSFAAATAALGTVVVTAGAAWLALRAAAAPRPQGGPRHDASLTCLFAVFVFGGGVAARAASALGGAGWRLCAAAASLGFAHAAAAVPLPAAAKAAKGATASQAVAAWLVAAVVWPALAVWLPFCQLPDWR